MKIFTYTVLGVATSVLFFLGVIKLDTLVICAVLINLFNITNKSIDKRTK